MVGAAVGAPAMSAADIHAKLGHIRAAWVTLNQKYRLTTGGPNEIEKVYVHFMPGFSAQASAGTEWNYAMQFVTRYSQVLTGAFDPTTLAAGVQSKVTYTGGTHTLTYDGIMTDAHKTALRAAVVVGDRGRIDTLYDKSNLFSTNRQIDSAQAWTGTLLRKHFLNQQGTETELAALKFLETWMNDKLSATYTLAAI
jgi:hypothetical protein